MKHRILITGGAGFLGSHLADHLSRAGYRVRLLDSLDPQVHPQGTPAYIGPDCELQVGSVLDSSAVRRALDDIAVVVHFAAIVGVGQSLYQPARYTETNVQGTAVLLEQMLDRQRRLGSGFGKLLLAGSMSVYGEGRYRCPECDVVREPLARALSQLRRQLWDPICQACASPLSPLPTDENKPVQLGSVYALTKYVQEQMCLLFGRTYEVPVVVLRFFNAYGPRQALTNPYTGVATVFASELLRDNPPQIYEDGRQLRDLVYVSDIANAAQLGLESARSGGYVYNIASGRPTGVALLAKTLSTALGKQIEPRITNRYRLGDARHCYADVSAARRDLGYFPRMGLEDGMRKLADWLMELPAIAPSHHRASHELLAYGLTG